MEEAFPMEERRSYEDQKALLLRDDYHMVGILEDDEVKAFLAYYDEGDYCFVEHLATSASMRGSGVGRVLLEAFLKTCTTCVLFEVELPKNEIARRRINFYKRLGCHLYPDIEYIQPSLQKGVKPLQLHIMSTVLLNNVQVKAYCERLYKDIYWI